MEIQTDTRVIKLYGNIKNDNDLYLIKEHIEKILSEFNSVVLELVDSISITSSVIGYLTKLVVSNNVNFEMYVSDDELYELLDDLNLLDVLHVKKS